jgi:hypothetical protein
MLEIKVEEMFEKQVQKAAVIKSERKVPSDVTCAVALM